MGRVTKQVAVNNYEIILKGDLNALSNEDMEKDRLTNETNQEFIP